MVSDSRPRFMEVLLIALLTLLNGVFAMSEMALASSRKARLAAMAEAGDNGAAAALRLMEQPTRSFPPCRWASPPSASSTASSAKPRSARGWRTGCRRWAWARAPSSYAATAHRGDAASPSSPSSSASWCPSASASSIPKPCRAVLAQPMSWLARAAGPVRASCCRHRRRPCSSCCRSTPTRARGMTEEEIAAQPGRGRGRRRDRAARAPDGARTCSTWTTGR